MASKQIKKEVFMKMFFAILVMISGAQSFASARFGYISARISAFEETSVDGGTKSYLITYEIQPCAQRFTKIAVVQLPELNIGSPGQQDVTNAGISVILRDSGIMCMGPTHFVKFQYTPDSKVKNPRPL